MNAEDVIKQVQEDASEWTEHAHDPAMFIAGVLANKIIALTGYIEYLEKRLQNVSR